MEETTRQRADFRDVRVFLQWFHQVLNSDENVDSSWNYDVIVFFNN